MFELSGPGGAFGVVLTVLISGVTLLGTGMPFVRGLRVAFQGLVATRQVDSATLQKGVARTAERQIEPMAVLLIRVIRKALKSNPDGQSVDFVVDAGRQYVMHEYDAHYAQRISMYANILPPIGFIGTTTGLFVLFLSMRVGSDSLELSALALALTSSIFALIGFAVLEGLKIHLYGRLLRSLNHALDTQRRSARPKQPGDGRSAVAPAA
jgi:hypothetical protein